MKDLELRKALDNYVKERGLVDEDELPILLTDHSYDKSIVGITTEGRIVYNYTSMINEYIEDEQCSWEEAQEWIDYNTMRAIPYFGPMRPIVLDLDRKEIIGIYGEGEYTDD